MISYFDALERCQRAERYSRSKSDHERSIAKLFAGEVWEQWTEHEKTLTVGPEASRSIERAYIAMIRCHALYVPHP